MNADSQKIDSLAQTLAVTAEICGTQLSAPAGKLLANDLAEYDTAEVLKALARCRRELKGRLTLAEIVARIDDGRPGPDEAYGMLEWEEEPTVVLTLEMQLARNAAWELHQTGDRTGARMAFKEAYTSLVSKAREARQPVEWVVELGWDKAGRIDAGRQAVRMNRITAEYANRLLGPGWDAEEDGRRLPPVAGVLARVLPSIRG